MASMRDIKRRIKSVSSTKQITKAMNLVSASKLQRSKARLGYTRPFYDETYRIISNIIDGPNFINNPFIKTSTSKRVAIIAITGDRGLCGGYNINIIKEANELEKDRDEKIFITIGTKARDYFVNRGRNVIESFYGISEQPTYKDAAKIGKLATDLYTSNKVDEVLIVYTHFESAISYIPKVEKLLPLEVSNFKNSLKEKSNIMIYEPNTEEILSFVVPRYINTLIYSALNESSACEQAARMTSMDSATKNANEAIEDMTILYNRARQGAITQEITEIIAGSSS